MPLTTLNILGLAMAGLSLAQTSTISLFVPGADTQPLVASVVGSDSKATTYAFQCAPGTDSSDCGFPGVVTLTEGPATAAYTFAPEVDGDGTTAFAGYFDCSLAASSAVCVVSAGGTEANDPGVTTTTLTGTDYTSMAVVITAGAALASNTGSSSVQASTTSSASKATGTSISGSTSGISSKNSGSQTSSGAAVQTLGTSSKASGTSTSTSTGGGPAITGSAVWMLGGAALALVAMA